VCCCSSTDERRSSGDAADGTKGPLNRP
jgi:hypothetical protein